MTSDRFPPRSHDLAPLEARDVDEFLAAAAQQQWPLPAPKSNAPTTYEVAFGPRPIRLGEVEFRILLFLASRPYHAFKRQAIVEAVNNQWMGGEQEPLTEQNVDTYVSSLRDQLGVLHDYVQSVPHIGYRFKA